MKRRSLAVLTALLLVGQMSVAEPIVLPDGEVLVIGEGPESYNESLFDSDKAGERVGLNMDLGAIQARNHSLEYMLGLILSRCRERVPEKRIDIYLIRRDQRVVAGGLKPEILTNEDFLKIYRAPDSDKATGEILFGASKIGLLYAIRIFADYELLLPAGKTTAEGLSIVVTSPEIIRKDLVRKTLLVPDEFVGRLAKHNLPKKLPTGGEQCLAFDPESKFLTIVDFTGAVSPLVLAESFCREVVVEDDKGKQE